MQLISSLWVTCILRFAGIPVTICILFSGCVPDAEKPLPDWAKSREIPVQPVAPPSPFGDSTWWIDSIPLLEMGRLQGSTDQQFYGLSGVVRLSNGDLVAANGGSNELFWFASDGERLRTVGRTGSGPGEFRLLDTLLLGPADTVVAWDHRMRRLSYFSPDGVLSRTIQIDLGYPGIPKPLAIMGNGSVLVQAWVTLDRGLATGRVAPDTIRFFLTSRDGTNPIPIATLPNVEFYGYRHPSGFETIGPLYPIVKAFAAGSGSIGYVGWGDEFVVGVFDSEGVWTKVLDGPETDRPVSKEDHGSFVEASVERQLREAPQFADPVGWRRTLSSRPTRDVFPEFERAVVDNEGNCWLLEYKEFWEPWERWRVISGSGKYLGTVVGPPGLRITQVGADFVLGMRDDSFGVEHVAIHALRRPNVNSG